MATPALHDYGTEYLKETYLKPAIAGDYVAAIGVTEPIHTINGGREAIAYMMGEGKYADRRVYAYPTFITTDLKMPGADGFDLGAEQDDAGEN